MPSRSRRISLAVLSLLPVLLLAGPSGAAEKAAGGKRTIERWLVLGPVPSPLPAFHDEKPGGFEPGDLLEERVLPDREAWPRSGVERRWPGGRVLAWQARRAAPDGRLTFAPPEGAGTAAVWLAAYLETDHFRSCKIVVAGSHPRGAWLDGASVARGKADGGDEASRNDEVAGTIGLTPGKHLLVVRTVLDPAVKGDWWVRVGIEAGTDGLPIEGLGLSVDPERTLEIHDVTDPPRPEALAVSPDGTWVASVIRRVIPGTDDAESWVEVRSTADGRLRSTWRGFEIDQVAWAPEGERLSYLTHEKKDDNDLVSLWLADLGSGKTVPLLERVENLRSYRWCPATDAIVYGVETKAEPDKRGVKRLEGLLDRQAGHRDTTGLYVASADGAVRRRLTAGPASAAVESVSPDGKRVLFTRTFDDVGHRPYVRMELWEMNLESFEARRLREGHFMTAARYAPDGKRILVLAGPSEFGDAGLDVPEGTIPNDYDGQLYIWDPATDHVEAITREFDPSVVQAEWSAADGDIYLRAEQGGYVRLFRYRVESREFVPLPAPFEVVEHFDIARDARVAVAAGSSPWTAPEIFRLDLERDRAQIIDRPAGPWFEAIRRGTTEPWSFTASSGRTIQGRIYFPPGFESSRKYPCIVYYYGGTSPIGREFGGRYPKEYWASLGYVVYVLQPSGATGYGQAFSALHVNDWGEIVSGEILDGVRRFLDARPYVDPKRVGCIGASYGGFITMGLVTKTDMFAAAVSHAGISLIPSYWGEGYWGYSYSAVAAANSFPWNRPDVFVKRSPLMNADKVKTPILLTHGTADTNVPVGESDAFYTALELAGAPVEYVQIEGQNHWILDHAKRIVWSRTIAAWFERWLEGRPEWWNDLYPEPK